MNSATAQVNECSQVQRPFEEPHQALWELGSRVAELEHKLAVALSAAIETELTRQRANRRRRTRHALAACS
jgi:hypothetical protein